MRCPCLPILIVAPISCKILKFSIGEINTKGAWNGDAPRPFGGKSKSIQDQVYTWEVYYKLQNADNPKRVVGHVTVLR